MVPSSTLRDSGPQMIKAAAETPPWDCSSQDTHTTHISGGPKGSTRHLRDYDQQEPQMEDTKKQCRKKKKPKQAQIKTKNEEAQIAAKKNIKKQAAAEEML